MPWHSNVIAQRGWYWGGKELWRGVSMATEKQFRIICYLKTQRFWAIAENADEGLWIKSS